VLKGFLMPRRCYDNVAQLRAALMVALTALGASMI
jgi:putative transposase